jgi:hypothetical protein
MRLALQGHPLHSRALSITLTERADAKLDVRGDLLDLRKRGFVPVAGDLQPSGVVHLMRIDAVVDPVSATIESIGTEQPAVAFEPSELSGGESCRDPIDRLQALRGAPVDAQFAKRLGAAIGGPRGCSHILTLAQLLGSTVSRALAAEREAPISFPVPHPSSLSSRRPGERIFRRDVIVDGHEVEEGRLSIGLQLTDLHLAPSAAISRPMERFAAQLELRLLAETRAYEFRLERIEGAERRRSLADLETAPWVDRRPAVEPLVGLPLLSGFAGQLLSRFAATPAERPLLDALLMLAPALIQIIAALSEDWPAQAHKSPSFMGTGGLPDSCYMWRRGGALSKRHKEEVDSGALQRRAARSRSDAGG